ncbi:MAG: phosphate acyltransferase PlsX, partial [Firmicutes bacterium]|nr:phosphate acyltransferase PlsX [Bacillota bacterium]
ALDALGGDHAPDAPVEGALAALRDLADLEVVLVGNQEQVAAAVKKASGADRVPRLSIHHAPDVIGMEESPVRAVRHKPDSSMVQTLRLVKDHQASAAISAGSTGALMAAGLLVLGRMPGIERPALSAILPAMKGWGVMLLDVGANLEPKSAHLIQYALLGSSYCQEVYGLASPRVGLLNIGSEARKGPKILREVHERLSHSSLNFIGNVEARELLSGQVDVVVSDGFSGNIALKLTEGLGRDLMGELRAMLLANWQSKAAAALLAAPLRRLKKRLDYQEYGGAPLLGLGEIAFKCHGASQGRAFQRALNLAYQYCAHNTHEHLQMRLFKEGSLWQEEPS